MGMKWASLYYVELCLKPPAWVYGVIYAVLKLAAASGAKYAPKLASHASWRGGEAAGAGRQWLAYGLTCCWSTCCLGLYVSGVPVATVPQASELLPFEERSTSMYERLDSSSRAWTRRAPVTELQLLLLLQPPLALLASHLYFAGSVRMQVSAGAGRAAAAAARSSGLPVGLPAAAVPHGDPPGD
jgi:hypothetical protein